MKKMLIFAAIFMFGAFSMVSAQDIQGMFNISPYVGIGIPMGDLAEDDPAQTILFDEDGLFRSMGFKFGASAEYFFTPAIGAGLDFMYAIHGSKELEEGGETLNSDDKLHTMNIGAHFKYVFVPEGMFRPYVLAGGGLTMNKFKDFPDEIDEDGTILSTVEVKLDTKMYLMGGVGAMYWVSDMISLFGEFGLDYLMTDGSGVEIDGETIEDAEVTANYYFLDFKVGLNVWFGGSE